jgi:hypothetical protein
MRRAKTLAGLSVAITVALVVLGVPVWAISAGSAVAVVGGLVAIARTEIRKASSHTDQDLWLRLHAFSGTDWDTLPWNVDRLRRQQDEAVALVEVIRRRTERQNRPALPVRILIAIRSPRPDVRAIERGSVRVEGQDVHAWWKS